MGREPRDWNNLENEFPNYFTQGSVNYSSCSSLFLYNWSFTATQSWPYVYVLSVGAYMLQWQSYGKHMTHTAKKKNIYSDSL